MVPSCSVLVQACSVAAAAYRKLLWHKHQARHLLHSTGGACFSTSIVVSLVLTTSFAGSGCVVIIISNFRQFLLIIHQFSCLDGGQAPCVILAGSLASWLVQTPQLHNLQVVCTAAAAWSCSSTCRAGGLEDHARAAEQRQHCIIQMHC